MKVKEEKFITWAEAKKILEKRTADIGELGYEQKNALEHLKRFSKLSSKKTQELITELRKTERLKDKHIMYIINMLPKTPEDLKVLFSNEMIELGESDQKRILSAVKKYV